MTTNTNGLPVVRFDQDRRVGFWRSESHPHMPVPIPGEPWEGKGLDLAALTAVEMHYTNRYQEWQDRYAACVDAGTTLNESAPNEVEEFKGFSTCRCCGIENGNREFVVRGWRWPNGYRHYLTEHNVRPDARFMKAIWTMMKLVPDFPSRLPYWTEQVKELDRQKEAARHAATPKACERTDCSMELCQCACHQPGANMMHMFECCGASTCKRCGVVVQGHVHDNSIDYNVAG